MPSNVSDLPLSRRVCFAVTDANKHQVEESILVESEISTHKSTTQSGDQNSSTTI